MRKTAVFGIFVLNLVGTLAANVTDSRGISIEKCCRKIDDDFATHWTTNRFYLTTYLKNLKGLNCSNFHHQCEHRPYVVSEFTDYVYKLFCNPSDLTYTCHEKKVFGQYSTDNASNTWAITLMPRGISLPNVTLPSEVISNACVQVAMYYDVTKRNDFVEVISTNVPFCDHTWLGMDAHSASLYFNSQWAVSGGRCRGLVGFFLFLQFVLAILIIFANTSIILVLVRTRSQKGSQDYYRFTIACADLVVGLLVIPSSIGNQIFLLKQGEKWVDLSEHFNQTKCLEEEFSSSSASVLGQGYLNLFGFVTQFSLFVSVFSLGAASCDRFYAVLKPYSFRNSSLKKWTKYICCSIVGFGFLVSLVPIMTNHKSWNYRVVAQSLIVGGGIDWLPTFTILAPLVIVCFVNFATFLLVLRKSSKSQECRTSKRDSIEYRLAKTLSVMVLAFTLSTLPLFVTVILGIIIAKKHAVEGILDVHLEKTFNSVVYCVGIVLTTNSLWNCVIYNARDKNFREKVSKEWRIVFYQCRGKQEKVAQLKTKTYKTTTPSVSALSGN